MICYITLREALFSTMLFVRLCISTVQFRNERLCKSSTRPPPGSYGRHCIISSPQYNSCTALSNILVLTKRTILPIQFEMSFNTYALTHTTRLRVGCTLLLSGASYYAYRLYTTDTFNATLASSASSSQTSTNAANAQRDSPEECDCSPLWNCLTTNPDQSECAPLEIQLRKCMQRASAQR